MAYQKCFLILFFAYSGILYAQNATQDSASSYFEEGKKLTDEGKYNQAVKMYERAAAEYRELDLRREWRICYQRIARIAREVENLEPDVIIKKALEETWWAEDLQTEILYELLGYYYLEYYDKPFYAKEAYLQAERIFDTYPDSLEKYRRAYILYLKKPLAKAYSQLGEAERAELYQNECAAFFRENQNWDELAKVYVDLSGTFWDARKFQKALEATYLDANLLDSIMSVNHAALLTNRANALYELDSLEKAGKVIAEAIQLFNAIPKSDTFQYEERRKYIYIALTLQGTIFQKKINFTKARESILQAQEEARKLAVQGRRVAKTDIAFAELEFELGNWEEAIILCQKALQKVYPPIKVEDIWDNPSLDEVYTENIFIEALFLKVKCLMAMYKEGGEKELLENAHTCITIILAVEDLYLTDYQYSTAQYQILEEAYDRHEVFLEVYEELRKLDTPGSDADMFSLSDRSRANLLLRGIKANEFLRNQGGSYPQKIQAVSRDINILKAKRLITQDAKKETIINQEIDDLLTKKRLLQDSIQLRFPDFAKAVKPRIISLGDIQSALVEGTQLLEFFWGDSAVYVFSLDKDEFRELTLPRNDMMIEWEKTALALMSEDSTSRYLDETYYCNFITTFQKGYELFLEPVINLQETKNLIIVPSGVFNYLPAEMLLVENSIGEKTNYQSLPYLLTYLNVYYLESANQLLDTKTENRFDATYMGIVPDYQGALANIVPVKNRETALSIAERFRGELLLDAKSRDYRENTLLPKTRIIHFWGHAEAEGNNAFLLFSSDALYDNSLYSKPLSCDLFLFTSCETGKGVNIQGEGVISLARAVRFSGAKSVLMSYWKANSASSSTLIQAYLDNLIKGNRKSEALRNAKLDYLIQSHSRDKYHPFYWSLYAQVGEDDEMRFERSQIHLYFILIPVIILLLILWRANRRRTH